jgi:hypothetical protein
MKVLFKYLIVTIVILGLIMPLLNLHAQELNGLYNELKMIKENFDLPADEKEKQEAALRKEALLKILDLSLAETENLINDLETLELNTEEQQKWRNDLIDILQTHREYYEKLKKELLVANLSINNSKLLAKGFQIWRKNSYNKNIPLITNFILIFNEQKVLKVADARLEKIVSELTYLEETNQLDKQKFELFLKNAKTALQNAWALNKKAERSLFDGENVSDIKLLVQASLKEVKDAYKEFLAISKKVKQLLNF